MLLVGGTYDVSSNSTQDTFVLLFKIDTANDVSLSSSLISSISAINLKSLFPYTPNALYFVTYKLTFQTLFLLL